MWKVVESRELKRADVLKNQRNGEKKKVKKLVRKYAEKPLPLLLLST